MTNAELNPNDAIKTGEDRIRASSFARLCPKVFQNRKIVANGPGLDRQGVSTVSLAV